jgi:hypothetical protein
MESYETPTITELGSVADFTRGDSVALDWDGRLFHRDNSGGGTPTS